MFFFAKVTTRPSGEVKHQQPRPPHGPPCPGGTALPVCLPPCSCGTRAPCGLSVCPSSALPAGTSGISLGGRPAFCTPVTPFPLCTSQQVNRSCWLIPGHCHGSHERAVNVRSSRIATITTKKALAQRGAGLPGVRGARGMREIILGMEEVRAWIKRNRPGWKVGGDNCGRQATHLGWVIIYHLLLHLCELFSNARHGT